MSNAFIYQPEAWGDEPGHKVARYRAATGREIEASLVEVRRLTQGQGETSIAEALRRC